MERSKVDDSSFKVKGLEVKKDNYNKDKLNTKFIEKSPNQLPNHVNSSQNSYGSPTLNLPLNSPEVTRKNNYYNVSIGSGKGFAEFNNSRVNTLPNSSLCKDEKAYPQSSQVSSRKAQTYTVFNKDGKLQRKELNPSVVTYQLQPRSSNFQYQPNMQQENKTQVIIYNSPQRDSGQSNFYKKELPTSPLIDNKIISNNNSLVNTSANNIYARNSMDRQSAQFLTNNNFINYNKERESGSNIDNRNTGIEDSLNVTENSK